MLFSSIVALSIFFSKFNPWFRFCFCRGKCEVVIILKDGGRWSFAFKNADVSVLTIEQQEEISLKLIDKKNYVFDGIFEVTEIDF